MTYDETTDLRSGDLHARMVVSQPEIVSMEHGLTAHLTRRLADALYAELLPVLRERVSKALDAAQIAKCIEGEISMAIASALGND